MSSCQPRTSLIRKFVPVSIAIVLGMILTQPTWGGFASGGSTTSAPQEIPDIIEDALARGQSGAEALMETALTKTIQEDFRSGSVRDLEHGKIFSLIRTSGTPCVGGTVDTSTGPFTVLSCGGSNEGTMWFQQLWRADSEDPSSELLGRLFALSTRSERITLAGESSLSDQNARDDVLSVEGSAAALPSSVFVGEDGHRRELATQSGSDGQ